MMQNEKDRMKKQEKKSNYKTYFNCVALHPFANKTCRQFQRNDCKQEGKNQSAFAITAQEKIVVSFRMQKKKKNVQRQHR